MVSVILIANALAICWYCYLFMKGTLRMSVDGLQSISTLENGKSVVDLAESWDYLRTQATLNQVALDLQKRRNQLHRSKQILNCTKTSLSKTLNAVLACQQAIESLQEDK